MALRLSGKVAAIGLLTVALITAFGSPRDAGNSVVPLTVSVSVELPAAVPLRVAAQLGVLHEPVVRDNGPAPLAGPVATPTFVVRATAYNSLESQTNSQPHVTATGVRTQWGIVAVSRDLLGVSLPYGSLVRLRDLGNFHNGRGHGAYQTLLDGTEVFIVEDTMHPRKINQIDLWFADYASAVNWGVRSIEVEVVRFGRHGPLLDHLVVEREFEVDPRWLAVR